MMSFRSMQLTTSVPEKAPRREDDGRALWRHGSGVELPPCGPPAQVDRSREGSHSHVSLSCWFLLFQELFADPSLSKALPPPS